MRSEAQDAKLKYGRRWLHAAAEWGNVFLIRISEEDSCFKLSLSLSEMQLGYSSLPPGAHVQVGLVVLKEQALVASRRPSVRHLVTAVRPRGEEAGVHHAISTRAYGTGNFIVVPLLRLAGRLAPGTETSGQISQRCILTVRCSGGVDVSQVNAKVLAAEAEGLAANSGDPAAGHVSEEDADEEEELFEAFDPDDALESDEVAPVPAVRGAASKLGLRWAKVGAERPKTGSEIKNEALAAALRKKHVFSKDEWEKLNVKTLPHDCYIKVADYYLKPAVGRAYTYWEKMGAAAIMDVRQEDDARMFPSTRTRNTA